MRFYSAVHIPQQEGIVQIFQPRIEKLLRAPRIAESALIQNLRRRLRKLEFFRERTTIVGPFGK